MKKLKLVHYILHILLTVVITIFAVYFSLVLSIAGFNFELFSLTVAAFLFSEVIVFIYYCFKRNKIHKSVYADIALIISLFPYVWMLASANSIIYLIVFILCQCLVIFKAILGVICYKDKGLKEIFSIYKPNKFEIIEYILIFLLAVASCVIISISNGRFEYQYLLFHLLELILYCLLFNNENKASALVVKYIVFFLTLVFVPIAMVVYDDAWTYVSLAVIGVLLVGLFVYRVIASNKLKELVV